MLNKQTQKRRGKIIKHTTTYKLLHRQKNVNEQKSTTALLQKLQFSDLKNAYQNLTNNW